MARANRDVLCLTPSVAIQVVTLTQITRRSEASVTS
jgi:hypothetical protein